MTTSLLDTTVRELMRTVVQWPEDVSPAYRQRTEEVLTRLHQVVQYGEAALDPTEIQRRLVGLRALTRHTAVPRDAQAVIRRVVRLAEEVLNGGDARAEESDGAALLAQAIDGSGLSARGYARYVADVDERTVRRQLAGELPVKGTARQLARAVVAHPEIVEAIRLDTENQEG